MPTRDSKPLFFLLVVALAPSCGTKTQVTDGGDKPEPESRTNCPLAQATAPGYSCGFVARDGNQLKLGGHPYRSMGFNRYELAGGPQTVTALCQRTPDPNVHIAYVKAFMHDAASVGATVVRFWAFQQFAGASGTDYSGFEKVIAAAKEVGLRVIPVIENNWSDCSRPAGLSEKDPNFYSTGYKAPYGYTLSLPDYVQGLVTHFKDEPGIAMWQVLNEGKLYLAPKTLATFLDTIAQQIKDIDANHLVSGGGSLQCWQGAQGVTDFKAYSASSAIDVLDQHDYGSASAAWPDCLEGARQAAAALGKPFIVGEAGISTGTSADNVPAATRATYFDAKIMAAASRGAQQYLIWSYNGDPVYQDDFDLLAGDPALQVFHDASKSVFKD